MSENKPKKKSYMYKKNDPKNSHDVYADDNPKNTIGIKYSTMKELENTIKKIRGIIQIKEIYS